MQKGSEGKKKQRKNQRYYLGDRERQSKRKSGKAYGNKRRKKSVERGQRHV